jgi:hypothetical protein
MASTSKANPQVMALFAVLRPLVLVAVLTIFNLPAPPARGPIRDLVNPDVNDPAVLSDFPDDPTPAFAGTIGVSTLRALVSQQGDLTGDGFETLSDLSAFRQEQGTSSQDTQYVDQ